MITVNVVCIGKIKEKFYVEACNEYIKRLNKFCKINILELQEEKLPANYSLSQIENVKNKESEQLIKHAEGFKILLDISGASINSVNLAKKINDIANTNSTISFIIGGSFGVNENLKKLADYNLSFSNFTFPHQLMRVILLEQVYRAFCINNNITYHK
jgi:23S rRNA (pseudouridine1915-N3)-methyltransferase